MIHYLKTEEKQETRGLYEASFPEDSKEFVDYYYTHKVLDNQIIVSGEEQLETMIHLNPFWFQIFGDETKINYVVAVATDERARKQGKMSRLLKQAMEDMAGLHQPFTFLMPANPKFYESSGFSFVSTESYHFFEKEMSKEQSEQWNVPHRIRRATKQDIPKIATLANQILEENYDIFSLRSEAYYKCMMAELEVENGALLLLEQNGQMCGLVSYGRDDEKIQIQEILLKREMGYGWKNALAKFLKTEQIIISDMNYMIRILDLKVLILLLKCEQTFTLKVKVKDEILPQNAGNYQITIGPDTSAITAIAEEEVECEMDISQLVPLLFGKTRISIREWV